MSVDPRFGPGWPNCDQNHGRVMVRLDFGLGAVFVEPYQSGAVMPLLRAVARVRAKNNELGPAKGYTVRVAGTYACRQMRTHPQASDHSWPVAIDINPDTNSMGSSHHDIPTWFVEYFRAEGFTWGGEWQDWMHFQNERWYGEWDGTYPEEDDVTPEQQQTLDDAKAFLDALRADLGNKNDPSKPAAAAGAGHRVARVVKAAEK